MNILEQQKTLESYGDDALRKEAENPTGSAPTFLVITEMQRRKDMRDNYKAQQSKANIEGRPSTVVDELVAQFGQAGGPPPMKMPGSPAVGQPGTQMGLPPRAATNVGLGQAGGNIPSDYGGGQVTAKQGFKEGGKVEGYADGGPVGLDYLKSLPGFQEYMASRAAGGGRNPATENALLAELGAGGYSMRGLGAEGSPRFAPGGWEGPVEVGGGPLRDIASGVMGVGSGLVDVASATGRDMWGALGELGTGGLSGDLMGRAENMAYSLPMFHQIKELVDPGYWEKQPWNVRQQTYDDEQLANQQYMQERADAIAAGNLEPASVTPGVPAAPVPTPVSPGGDPSALMAMAESLGWARGGGSDFDDLLTKVDDYIAELPDRKEAGNMAMMAAGLGMMGGQSPFAGVNIAKGGMEGLKTYESMMGDRRKGLLGTMSPLASIASAKQRASSGALDAASRYALSQAQMQSGRYTPEIKVIADDLLRSGQASSPLDAYEQAARLKNFGVIQTARARQESKAVELAAADPLFSMGIAREIEKDLGLEAGEARTKYPGEILRRATAVYKDAMRGDANAQSRIAHLMNSAGEGRVIASPADAMTRLGQAVQSQQGGAFYQGVR